MERKRVRMGDVAFWLAIASSTLIGLTFLVSEVGSLLGAPPQQAGFTLMIGGGIAAGLLCALAGVLIALSSRRRPGARRKARNALLIGYCILGSLAALAVLGTVALIAIAND